MNITTHLSTTIFKLETIWPYISAKSLIITMDLVAMATVATSQPYPKSYTLQSWDIFLEIAY